MRESFNDSWEVRTTSTPLAVRSPEQPPTLQPQAARVIDEQSWTALFRAFSSHQQLSAYLIKRISQMDKPLGQLNKP